MPKPMTKRQQAIFDYIQRTIRARGAPPTIREIMEGFGISSTNGVRTTLAALERKGHIRRHARLSRGIELADAQVEDEPTAGARSVAMVGRVAAGYPILATENIEAMLQVDPSLLPGSGRVFALRVQGESMRDAGILDGDIVLARQQEQAEHGDIVVALLGDEATVKYYHPGPEGVRLVPANDAFRPIVVAPETDGFHLAGKVVGLMRRL
jgi:repressor LexA